MAGIEATLDNGRVRVVTCAEERLCNTLRERGYLRDSELNPLEAALQAIRGKLSLDGLHGWDAALRILSLTGFKLKLFLAYITLRSRYPVVYSWTRRDTLLAYRDKGRRLEVLVLEEGEEVRVEDIAGWSEAAVKDDHEPIVLIVDRNGSVTMYSARVMSKLS